MEELSLRELAELNECEYSIEDTRRDLGRIVELFKQTPYQENCLKVIAEDIRQLTPEIIKEHDIFFVDEDTTLSEIPEELQAEALGFVRHKRIIYAGRLVYPVKDVRGQVMGLCGWDIEELPKYLDSKNHGYKAKGNTLYGMEKLPEYYRSGKPVYIVEGIVCCLYLRSIGLQALALLGSNFNPYIIQILKRFKVCIIIPDNDTFGKSLEELNEFKPAGEHLVKLTKKKLKSAIIVQSKVAKDIDDSRKVENHKYEQQLIKDLKQVAICPYLPLVTLKVR